jgi:hypothetical protein
MKIEEIGSFEVTKYDFQFVNGQPKLVISMIKVFDANGKYVKFAKLKEVQPFLSKFPIKFKDKEQDQ